MAGYKSPQRNNQRADASGFFGDLISVRVILVREREAIRSTVAAEDRCRRRSKTAARHPAVMPQLSMENELMGEKLCLSGGKRKAAARGAGASFPAWPRVFARFKLRDATGVWIHFRMTVAKSIKNNYVSEETSRISLKRKHVGIPKITNLHTPESLFLRNKSRLEHLLNFGDTALLIHDMQNYFVSFWGGRRLPDDGAGVANITALHDLCKQHNIRGLFLLRRPAENRR